MAQGTMRKYMEKRLPSSFKIQITSMVDMFVILLVFLLKSYSTSPVLIDMSKELQLPSSSSQADPVEVVKLVVAQNGIYMDDKMVVELKDGQLRASDIDKADPNFIGGLFKTLDEQAKKTKNIAELNETVKFDGRILMQADKKLPYAMLQKVMYTSMLAGYADVKLAVVSNTN
jgi:biopolymer transport protein ExbD